MKLFWLLPLFLLLFSFIQNSFSEETTLQNIGNNINTKNCNELNPIVSSDGSKLFFCRCDCDNSNENQNIWFSEKGSNGKWMPAVKLGAPLNNKYNNFIASVSPDGNTILLGGIYHENGTMGRGVSISRLSENGWTYPEPLEIDNYYNKSEFSGFFLCDDGKTLLLSLQREDSRGEKDIYVSFMKNDGRWSEPISLGNNINTAEDEISPYLASDGITLFFSSKGHKGYGDADIFISRRLDKSWTNWSEPVNLGDEINTEGWEAYYKTTASGEYAYCVSEKNSLGKSDIFKTKIPDRFRPNAVMLVKGKVINYKTMAPLESKINFSIIPDGDEAGYTSSNPVSGSFRMTLPAGHYYSYEAMAPEFVGSNYDLDLRELYGYKEFERNIELVPAEDSLVCIRNIFFASNQTKLSKESSYERKKLLEFLSENPNTVCEISGYTDSRGSKEINEKLSRERAKNAANYFIRLGISSDRLIMKGFAMKKFVMPNDTEEGRALNRRVEFKVYER